MSSLTVTSAAPHSPTIVANSGFKDAALAVTYLALAVIASLALLVAMPIEVAIPASTCLFAGALLYLFIVAEPMPRSYHSRSVHLVSPGYSHYSTMPSTVYVAPARSTVPPPLYYPPVSTGAQTIHRAPVNTQTPTFAPPPPSQTASFHRAPVNTGAPTFAPPPSSQTTSFHRGPVNTGAPTPSSSVAAHRGIVRGR